MVRSRERQSRRMLGLVAGMVAAASVATWLLGRAPDAHGGGDVDRGQSRYEAIACSKMIAVVTVGRLETVPGSQRVRATLTVDKWIKPSAGERYVTVELADPDAGGGDTILTEGRHALVWVPVKRDQPPAAFEREIPRHVRQAEQDLPTAEQTPCPPEWR